MTADNEPETKSPQGDQQSGPTVAPAARRSRSFFVVMMFLITLITIAFFIPDGNGGNVETSRHAILELLHAGKIASPVHYVQDLGRFDGKIKRSQEELAAGKSQGFLLVPGSEQGIHEFKRELDKYNAKRADSAPDDLIHEIPERSNTEFWGTLVNVFLLILFVAVLYIVFIRPMRASGPAGGIFSFGKSRARMAEKGATGITFDDVAGIDEAKDDVQEIIEFLKKPERFLRLGGRIPRGVVLAGAPGTGKTLLAKAMAGEADVPFFSISGSDFVEMFVGVGASRVRDLFKQARENSPCIIFLDEIDAVGRRRGAGLGGAHDEREQTLNAILVEMDGFDGDCGIVMVAATNRPDVLDPALLRPGRFDREIVIELPDIIGREEILNVHTKRVKLEPGVNLQRLAQLTPTFSGAELAALVNEAAIIAAMQDAEAVREEHFETARDKIRFGRERSSRCFSEEDLKITAYHEAGHAVVSHVLPEVESPYKVTIIPRGMALGATMQLPEGDRYHISRNQLYGQLMVLYAGRIAEKLFCDDITAGATNDIERATDLARRMVCDWGMSDAIGPIKYSEKDDALLTGRETLSRGYSEAVAQRIDDEIRRLVDTQFQKTEKLLRRHRGAIDRVGKALLAKETLTGEEVATLVDGGEIELPEKGRRQEAAVGAGE